MTDICSIHHVSMIISSTDKSLAFYRGLLGLDTVERPDLPFPGIWLKIGDQQLHLLELPNPDPVDQRPEHGGRDRHLALSVRDLDVLAASLEGAGVSYTRSRSGRDALFCRDPDGNALEFIQQEK
ncbi:MAG TPA: glyoxalase [Thiolapillus brandeum]|uniref:Glyoxalase n=1 Tax=Thiolapillus brandeum TaxID=1076588 RepID=A0A831W717_9GAMM|nr:glyoxalase [Thiolapillus brandeum]